MYLGRPPNFPGAGGGSGISVYLSSSWVQKYSMVF